MGLSGDLQDRDDVQTLNQWVATHESLGLAGKVLLDASLPPHGFQVLSEKLYLGVAAYHHLRRFLAGRGIKVDSSYFETAQG